MYKNLTSNVFCNRICCTLYRWQEVSDAPKEHIQPNHDPSAFIHVSVRGRWGGYVHFAAVNNHHIEDWRYHRIDFCHWSASKEIEVGREVQQDSSCQKGLSYTYRFHDSMIVTRRRDRMLSERRQLLALDCVSHARRLLRCQSKVLLRTVHNSWTRKPALTIFAYW